MIVKSPSCLNAYKWEKAGIAIIEVNNLARAYLRLARYYRERFSLPCIQVIGSSGKTTTKEMVGAVLKENFKVLVSIQNLNSPEGVARNLFRLDKSHQVAVLEAGMKGPGIMRSATRLIKPDLGVITSIHRAHLLRLGSIQKIIAAKAEMLEYLSPYGTLIINWNDPNCHKFPLGSFKGKVLRYGFSNQCDLWAENLQRQEFSTHFTVSSGKFRFPCTINTIGKYNVGNALAAVAVGMEMGMKPEEIARGLEHFEPLEGRLKVYRLNNGAVIIDDNFNANPDSTRLLVDELIIMARKQPVGLVIGDMERPSRNIAPYARRVHHRIGWQLARGNFIHIMAVGQWAREYVEGAVEAGFSRNRTSYFVTTAEAEESFKKLLKPGTTMVLKASPYTKLNTLRIHSLNLSE